MSPRSRPRSRWPPAGERRLHRADHSAEPDLGGADLSGACGSTRRARGAAGVYLLGGVHAREWGSSDILINFVQVLTDAYRTGTGITQGGRDLQRGGRPAHRDDLDVVVFPAGQPGRPASLDDRGPDVAQEPPPGRTPGSRPAAVGGGDGPGVDLNRNYDFLWDFPTKFSPQAPVATSTDPCSEVYRGPSAASEPETAQRHLAARPVTRP